MVALGKKNRECVRDNIFRTKPTIEPEKLPIYDSLIESIVESVTS